MKKHALIYEGSTGLMLGIGRMEKSQRLLLPGFLDGYFRKSHGFLVSASDASLKRLIHDAMITSQTTRFDFCDEPVRSMLLCFLRR